jgi:beta-lactamase regulating signal transducer with metallopeptidase domain
MSPLDLISESTSPLLDLLFKGTLLLAFACLLAMALRRASAALRHLVWVVAITGILLLPAIARQLPTLEVSWFPQWKETAVSGEQPARHERYITFTPHSFDHSDNPIVLPSGVRPVTGSKTAGNGTVLIPETRISESAIPVAASDKFIASSNNILWIIVVWAVGALLCLSPLVFGLWRLRGITHRAGAPDEGVEDQFAGACRQLDIQPNTRLLATHEIKMPLTWGFLRAVVLVPADFCDWPEQRREFTLLHELAHIKRGDWLTQLIASLAASAYWFHPLVWLAARRMRIEREQACDDLVLRNGPRPSDYADELLKIATSLGAGRWMNPAAVPMARKSSLEGRVLSILDATRRRGGITPLMAIAIIGLAGMTTIPVAMLSAGNPSSSPATAPNQRHFVRIVKDPVGMTFEGRPVVEAELRNRLREIVDRTNTVVELAISTNSISWSDMIGLQRNVARISQDLGFEYTSIIGTHPAGSKGSPPQRRINQDPLAKKNAAAADSTSPREVVNQWLDLTRRMKPKDQWEESEKRATWNALWNLSVRDSAAAPSVDTQRLWALRSIRPEFQLGSDEAAMVVTTPYRDNSGRDRVHYFLLTRKTNRWLIARAEYGSPDDAQKRVEGFQMYPGVRHNVQPSQLVGDWVLAFFSHTYLKLHADGRLSLSHSGSTDRRSGTWSVKGDIFTQTLDGETTSSRIRSITRDSFRYALPNGNVAGFKRQIPAAESADRKQNDRALKQMQDRQAATKALVEAHFKVADAEVTRARGLVDSKLLPPRQLAEAEQALAQAQAEMQAARQLPDYENLVSVQEESRLRLAESQMTLQLYRKLAGTRLWNALASDSKNRLLIDQLAARNQLAVEHTSKKGHYGASHPSLIRASEQLKHTEQQLDQHADAILNAMEIKVTALGHSLSKLLGDENRPALP